MGLLLKNVAELLMVEQEPRAYVSGEEMARVGRIENAWLRIENDRIADFGSGALPPEADDELLDCGGGMVMPAYCDSHTHLVYAGSREREYEDKIRGLSYEEIARRGGGILNSAALLSRTSEDALFEQSLPRLKEIIASGTAAVEIKSGYGLNPADELKMLRVVKRLREEGPLEIRATFLGAHAVPAAFKDKQDAYVDQVVKEMIPAVAEEGLADYIDVFCDRGFFTVGQTARILEAGARYEMQPKIHANELDFSGGIQVGVEYRARSVDHLEYVGQAELDALRGSGTMATLLPGASFFLNIGYAPARKLIDAGLPVALASDYNPGSSPTGNMELIMSLGITQLRMLPYEVLNAVTLNGAYAMGLETSHGTIRRGKKASLIVTHPMPSFGFMPYSYGSSQIAKVILNGKIEHER
ncbi:MAG: imidazolonepropionase [Bacteroidetes bacterium]|nr:MAG: imidazolonepropionase [Bacteroidota bacterium]